MSEHEVPDHGNTASPESEEHVPFMQRLLDNPFMLLFLGVVVPAVLYIIWGVMEIVSIPISPDMK